MISSIDEFDVGWFVVFNTNVRGKENEMYQLSSRARMELEHYLIEKYPRQANKDYECKICNELVMKVSLFLYSDSDQSHLTFGFLGRAVLHR